MSVNVPANPVSRIPGNESRSQTNLSPCLRGEATFRVGMNQILNTPFQIWIAEDEEELRETLGRSLSGSQRVISLFESGKALLDALKSDSAFDIILADLIMPEIDGLKVLEEAKECNPDGVVIIMTGYASLDTAIQAIRGGAYDYIRKPFKLGELEVVVKNACEKISLVRENRHLLQTLKEMMEEMKQYSLVDEGSNLQKLSFSNLDQKISEMDVLLRQMAPPDYDFKSKEYREQTFQNLKKLVQWKKEGYIDDGEFLSAKKILFGPFQDS
jgi:DNA-binding response OmpR family regulator